jgi:hypothetical protein
MALQTANQFQLGTDFSQLGKGVAQGVSTRNQFELGQQRGAQANQQAEQARVLSVVQGASEIQNIPTNDGKLNALMVRRQRLLDENKPTQDTDEAIGLFQSGRFDEANGLIDGVVNAGIQQGLLKAPATAPAGFTLGAGQTRFDAQGNEVAGVAPTVKPVVTSALDQARINKINAETAALSSGTSVETPELDTLVAGSSIETQNRAKAAFNASGGGDPGVKALQKVLEDSVETERRAAAPETLKANFPQADEAELQELQAVVDSSKTTESGFKAAGQLRDKQRQVKKGKVFQTRAVELLNRILNADELDDVLGSIEGSDESLIPFGGQKIRGDNESEIIADIEEAGNILTADNLDIMSGVLSETDIKIIANLAGGALNRKRGEKAFKKDVTKLKEKMEGALGVVGGNKLPSGTTDNKDGTFTLPSGQIVRRKRG